MSYARLMPALSGRFEKTWCVQAYHGVLTIIRNNFNRRNRLRRDEVLDCIVQDSPP